jgi:hypothetical protein
MFRSFLFLAFFTLPSAYADDLPLKDEAHFECSVSAGQYWPGSKSGRGRTGNLFIETDTFKYDFKATANAPVTLTLADFKNRFNGGNDVPFTRDMAKGYDLEVPFEISIRFFNSLKMETSIDWKLADYGAQPLVLMQDAVIEKGVAEAKYSFVLPHKDSTPTSTYSVVHVNVRCKEI